MAGVEAQGTDFKLGHKEAGDNGEPRWAFEPRQGESLGQDTFISKVTWNVPNCDMDPCL